jgi:hypothetical protein
MTTNLKDVIKTLIRQEIKKVIGEHDDLIEEMVRSYLLPELRAAVHESVCNALENLQGGPPEIKNNQPVVDPSPEWGHGTSDIRPETSDLGNPDAELRAPPSPFGKYVYCIADSTEGEGEGLGKIGIEQNEVYSIPYKDVCAIVHNCPAKPYQSEDPEIVKGWVMTHQKVVDAAWNRFGTVIPIGFDTIIQGDEEDDPEETMKKWLESDYDSLKAKMEKIEGRAEYGVQILWDKKIAAKKATDKSDEIKELSNKIRSKPRGVAYMYRQKLDSLVRKEIENLAERYFREFYEKIVPHAEDIRVEKTRKIEDEEKQMLLNLSCLLPKGGSQALGDELEAIDAIDGFSVRYTGPWPPYSFV